MRGMDPGSVRVLRVATPPVVGAVLALAMLLAIPSSRPAARPRIGAARLEGTRAEDCAPCHAREVAQWRASAMAFAVRSPLVGALESLVEEQVGRDSLCPAGAGVLRARGGDACVDSRSGLSVTGAGGQDWCVNCHSPGENLHASMPPWSARRDATAREPLRDVLSAASLEGISCAACHSTIGPVAAHASRVRAYEGNATWTSVVTGAVFPARPEDDTGLTGIANSGYSPEPLLLLGGARDGARVHPSLRRPRTATCARARSAGPVTTCVSSARTCAAPLVGSTSSACATPTRSGARGPMPRSARGGRHRAARTAT